jgi:hypothetical protein
MVPGREPLRKSPLQTGSAGWATQRPREPSAWPRTPPSRRSVCCPATAWSRGGGIDLGLIIGSNLVHHLLVAHRVAHKVGAVLKRVLGLNAGTVGIIFCSEPLGLLHKALDLLFTRIVLDSDLLLFSSRLEKIWDFLAGTLVLRGSCGLDAQGEWRGINDQDSPQCFGLIVSRQNGGLHSGAIGNGLVGIDALVQLLAVEELRKHLLNLGDTGGSTH